ncbi:hypothetical protein, partial [Proteus terrae]|uniref:hypothetical protein n=1 Tax=Proteus terrae TaxID=1574161 RepID=UPI0032D9B3E6
SFSRRHSPLVLPSHHGSHFFFRFLEIDTKQCVAIETELKTTVVQYFLMPVWRKIMESLTLSVFMFYLGICYDSLIACISQMIVFNKKKKDTGVAWLKVWLQDSKWKTAGKARHREAVDSLILGTAGTSKTLC